MKRLIFVIFLLVFITGCSNVVEETEKESETLKDDFSDLLKHSEEVAKDLWDNKEDEIWDTI